MATAGPLEVLFITPDLEEDQMCGAGRRHLTEQQAADSNQRRLQNYEKVRQRGKCSQ